MQNQSCGNDLLTVRFGLVDVGAKKAGCVFHKTRRFKGSPHRLAGVWQSSGCDRPPRGRPGSVSRGCARHGAARTMALGVLSPCWEVLDRGSASRHGPFSRHVGRAALAAEALSESAWCSPGCRSCLPAESEMEMEKPSERQRVTCGEFELSQGGP